MSLVGGANMKEVHTLSERTPRISLFGKKNAIGIGKDVILLLGAPTHIRIRVNEENDSLVIECLTASSQIAIATSEFTANNLSRTSCG